MKTNTFLSAFMFLGFWNLFACLLRFNQSKQKKEWRLQEADRLDWDHVTLKWGAWKLTPDDLAVKHVLYMPPSPPALPAPRPTAVVHIKDPKVP